MPNTNWLEISDLSIFEAAFWMQMNSDPWAHEYRCACDADYANNFDDLPGGSDAVDEKCFVLESLIRTGEIKTTKEICYSNQKLDRVLTRINKSDWLKWCYHNGYKERFAQTPPAVTVETVPAAPTVTDPLEHAALVQVVPEMQTKEPKPWLIANLRDPKPEQPWYTSARYFARQLVIEDSTLPTKKNLLAEKVSKSLFAIGIKKRGGKKPFGIGTILKAFSNVILG